MKFSTPQLPESVKSLVTDTHDAGAGRRAQELLSVGQVAQRGGVSVSALHFYERQGLIFSTRTSGNQRRYARS